MGDFPYAAGSFKIRAEIGGTDFRDIVQFTSSFEMNTIPTGMLWVAVGREVLTGKLATIHRLVKQLNRQVPVKVFLEVKEGGHQDVELGLDELDKSGGALVFEGDVVGIGFRRTVDSLHMGLHLLHWLAHLHYGSAVSATSHPGNPGDWTYPAAYAAIGLGGAGNAGAKLPGPPTWVPMIQLPDVTPGQVEDDLWGKVLHKYLLHLASDDPIDDRLVGGQEGGADERTLDALRRIGPGVPNYVPLGLDLAGADSAIIAKNIRDATQMEAGSQWINTTMWGKIIGDWAPAYWLAVVPRVVDAVVIPWAPGLRKTYKTIKANEYSTASLSGQLHQTLRAVFIAHATAGLTGVDLNLAGIPAARSGLAGCYNPAGIDTGMVLIKDAPRWLSDPVLPWDFSQRAAGAAGNELGLAFEDDGVGDDRKPQRDLVNAEEKSHPTIMNKFAKAWYAIEVLKGRTGEISGKLRYDISPGSQVKLLTAVDSNVGGGDGLAVPLHAIVTRVTQTINSESAQAGTSFTLAHLRNDRENGEAWATTDRPPLYAKAWVGSPLIQ